MPTAPSHAVSAIAILAVMRRPPTPVSLWFAGAACAMLPDVDVIGFRFGIRYGDLLGHRGLTHSVVFAAALATLIVAAWSLPGVGRARAWTYFFVCTMSHAVLDAATNGGLGIAFLSPFSNARFFWPWRPIQVSPIGVGRVLSRRGTAVILSELWWVWVPSIAVVAAAYVWRTAAARRTS